MFKCNLLFLRLFLAKSYLHINRSKLAVGLLSGQHSIPITDSDNAHQQGIKPFMFKSIIGRGHPEFSTKRQQDAVEFLLHLINVTEVRIQVFIFSHVIRLYSCLLLPIIFARVSPPSRDT